MSKKCFGVCVTVLGLALSVCAQGTIDEHGVRHPSEEEVAAHRRLIELLGHPTFITLRLASVRRYMPREEPSTTPSPYTVDQWINFQLFMSQSLSETLTIWETVWPYDKFRPELYRDGDILSYSKNAQKEVDIADSQPPSGSGAPNQLIPGREYDWGQMKMDDWYEPLRPGHYQLIVRKRFVSDGDWVESNPVTFDVIPRKPAAPIPDGVRVRLVPKTAKGEAKGQPYRMANDDYFAVEIVNDSDRPVKITVIDGYYGHRLQLTKDGKVLPYLEAAAKLIQSKDSDLRLVELGDLVVPPKTTSLFDGVGLKQWYGPLAPGLYRLTDRRRLEIDGPWTADSGELVFEVVPQPERMP